MTVPFTSSRVTHVAAGLLLVASLMVVLIIAMDRGDKDAPVTERPIQVRTRHAVVLEETGDRGRDNQADMANDIQWALDEGDPSEARAEELLTNLFKTGRYADALEVAQALERGLHRELIPTAVEAWAEANGQAAWDAIATLPPHQVDLRLLVLRHWPESQVEGLGNLIVGMPEGGVKSAALGELIRKRGQSDPAGLSEWLAAHPQDTEVMDQAAEFFVYSCDQENRSSEVAAQWAARISSRERRERAMEAVAREQQMAPAVQSTPQPGTTDAD